jgi:hypothetical protein
VEKDCDALVGRKGRRELGYLGRAWQKIAKRELKRALVLELVGCWNRGGKYERVWNLRVRRGSSLVLLSWQKRARTVKELFAANSRDSHVPRE